MFVCANGRGDYLRREGGTANEYARTHPSLMLRAVAVFRTETDARKRCGEMQDAAKLLGEHSDLGPILLSDFGKRINDRWRIMLEQQHSVCGSVFSDPDVG